ncbi:MAG TPA: hypothetical protein VLA12_03945, partial [Planctomycetaceae bacterium]|nr:hypothetical protein [Planctomycetaceae bacterium]
GTVDYAAFLNQKYSKGVTPETNASVWYWRAIGPHRETSQKFRDELVELLGTNVFAGEGPWLLDMGEFGQQKIRAGVISSQEQFNAQWEKATEKPWTEDEYPLIAEWLKANEKPLQHVVKAGRQPDYFAPLVDGDPLISTLLTGVQLHREFARILVTRAMLNAGRKDYDAASRDLMSMFHLAYQTGRGPTAIEGLVGCAITAIAEDALQKTITGTDIDEKQLAKLQQELSTLTPAFDVIRALDECERCVCLDAIQYVTKRNSDSVVDLLDLNFRNVDPLVRLMQLGLLKTDVDWNVALQRINIHMDEMIEIQKLASYAERKQGFAEFCNRNAETQRKVNSIPFLAVSFIIPESGDERVGQLLETSLLPALQQIGEAANRAEVRRRVSPLGCAIERYRRLKGNYPPNLAALVPTYISELPTDPYTDKGFHFRVNSDRSEFAVFTFGPNERDDNGLTWGEGTETDDMGMHSAGWLSVK